MPLIASGQQYKAQRYGSGAANSAGATNYELAPDFMRSTDFEKPPRCLPSLAADC
jgi:hypothetical protein